MDEDIRQLQTKLRRRGLDVVVLKKDTYAMAVAFLKEEWERTRGSYSKALIRNILERLLEDYETKVS